MVLSKQAALDIITATAAEAGLTGDEIAAAMSSRAFVPPAVTPQGEHVHNLSFMETLTYVGAIIVVAGLSIFIGQNWEFLSVPMRLFVTLGLGAAFSGTALYLMQRGLYERAANAFHIIGAYGLAVGAYVVIDTLGAAQNHVAWIAVAAVLASIYLAADYFLQRLALSLLAVVFCTGLFWTIIWALLADVTDTHIAIYAWMVMGASYIALAVAWASTRRNHLKGVLAAFGAFATLGAAFVLAMGDEGPEQFLWAVLLPVMAAGAMYLSTRLRTGGMFTFALLWLVIYIFWITGRYFAQTIGWPIALMFAGLALIGIGYVAVGVKRRYLSRSSAQ